MNAIRSAMGAVLRLSCLLATFDLSTCMGEDRWAPGSEWPNWRKIEALQNYPFPIAEPIPNLASACTDKDPLVRAAACMALGRTASADHLPLLVPLLDDECESVRRFSLAAILHVESAQIKPPVLKVVGTWEDLQPNQLFHYHSSLGLIRLGLPPSLLKRSSTLEQRQAWLARPEAAAWKPSFPATQNSYAYHDGRTCVSMSMPNTEIDSDEKLAVKFRVVRRGGKRSAKAFPERERVYLGPISERGEVQSGGGDIIRTSFRSAAGPNEKRLTVTLPPEGDQDFELVVASHETLLPGIYVFHVETADWPLLVRIRRSKASEDQAPAWIAQLPDPQAAQRLGEQRVKAAVPALIQAFVANAGKNNFATARALARIGDPAAIPVLLKYPRMQDNDLLRTTERELAMFGPEADAYYEQLIVNWRTTLTGSDAQSLPIALKRLGPRGSAEVVAARLALIKHLGSVASIESSTTRENPELQSLTAGAWASAAAHPCEVTNAIWATRDRPRVFNSLLYNSPLATEIKKAKAVIVELHKRSRQPGEEQVPRDRLDQLHAIVTRQ